MVIVTIVFADNDSPDLAGAAKRALAYLAGNNSEPPPVEMTVRSFVKPEERM